MNLEEFVNRWGVFAAGGTAILLFGGLILRGIVRWIRSMREAFTHWVDLWESTERASQSTERAINHQPEGSPTIAESVTRIAEGLAQVAAEADRKHEENQADIARLTRDQARNTERLDMIARALGARDPWDPSQGDRRRQ